jgi:hypothetical protein
MVIVAQEGPDSDPHWSPDGTQLAFVTAMARPFYFYQNSVIATIAMGSTTPRSLTDAFDEAPNLVAWTKAGIQFSASQRTWSYLFTLNPSTKQVTKHAVRDAWIGSGFSLTPDGTQVAFTASGPAEFPDVYVAPVATMAAKKLSDAGAQIASWPKHSREVYRWKSQDGAEIEGGAAQARRFPGGQALSAAGRDSRRPDRASLDPFRTAAPRPIRLMPFLAKGALVLEPNYRGSAGYGEKFRSLNVRNLGIGDAWDVLSGIDALVQQGLVDRDRVGSMGWSQGGYISAFLTTKHSDRFKADLGRRGHFGLDDVLRQHRHPSLHAAVPQGDAVGRSEDLCRHLADDVHQAGQGADTDSARRSGCARADSKCIPALSGPARSERAGATVGLQGLRARHQQAEGEPRRHAAESRLVHAVYLEPAVELAAVT